MIDISVLASSGGRSTIYQVEASFDPDDFTSLDDDFASGPVEGELIIGSDSFAFDSEAVIVFLEGEPDFSDSLSIFTSLDGGGPFSEISLFASGDQNFFESGEILTPLGLSDFEVDGFSSASLALLPEDTDADPLFPTLDSFTVVSSTDQPGETPEIGAGLSEAAARTVAYLYEAGLDRDGNIDTRGLNFWIDQREDGLSETGLATAFLNSAEFEAAFGAPSTLSDRELVEVLYENVLNRAGEQAGIDFWTAQVDRPDFSRPDLLLAFALSPENIEGSPDVATLTEVSGGEWDFV